jgi:hypothetical protein
MHDASEPASAPAAAYARIDERTFHSTALTRGPWNPDHQHAGPPTAIVCGAVEKVAQAHGLTHISRLTANLIRPVPIGNLCVEVVTDYVGRNAGHFSAHLMAGSKEVGRFTALAQRPTHVELPESLPGHPLPAMAVLPDRSVEAHFPFKKKQLGYGHLVQTRAAAGRMFAGPCSIWFRLLYPLLEGEEPSPYQRVAVAADSGNGISAILDFQKFSFVNFDLTVNLLRPPEGEWICLEAKTYASGMGAGLAESALYDVKGFIGRSTQNLSIRRRTQE